MTNVRALIHQAASCNSRCPLGIPQHLDGPARTTANCWALLAAPDGSSRKEHYLPKGDREPETAYRKWIDAACPTGFFRDAFRTYAGMLNRGSWLSLPASLISVLIHVDGRGTDLGVFLAVANLLVLRDVAALGTEVGAEEGALARPRRQDVNEVLYSTDGRALWQSSTVAP